jgi:hypothetical protein
MAWHTAGYRAPGLVRVRAEARTWPAAVSLFVLAALIPESVATFNTPPLVLLTRPVALPFLCAFYGSAGLLVREFARRRRPRWVAVIMLGMAAGALNEGIIAGTWYKVQYPGYAMVGPVDPAVAVGLTVFHTLVSTILPILLAELMFPRIAGQSWVSGRALSGSAVLLALTVATGFGPAPHRGAKSLVLAGVLALVAVAVRRPARPAAASPAPARTPGRTVPGPVTLHAAGAAAITAFYVIFGLVPGVLAGVVPQRDRAAWQALPILLMLVLFAGVLAVARDWRARPGWGLSQLLSVITGVLLPPIALSVLLPAALSRLEPLVTVPMLALLLVVRRRLSRRGDEPARRASFYG